MDSSSSASSSISVPVPTPSSGWSHLFAFASSVSFLANFFTVAVSPEPSALAFPSRDALPLNVLIITIEYTMLGQPAQSCSLPITMLIHDDWRYTPSKQLHAGHLSWMKCCALAAKNFSTLLDRTEFELGWKSRAPRSDFSDQYHVISDELAFQNAVSVMQNVSSGLLSPRNVVLTLRPSVPHASPVHRQIRASLTPTLSCGGPSSPIAPLDIPAPALSHRGASPAPLLAESSTPLLAESSTPPLAESSTPLLAESSPPPLAASFTPLLAESSTPPLAASSTPLLAASSRPNSPVLAQASLPASPSTPPPSLATKLADGVDFDPTALLQRLENDQWQKDKPVRAPDESDDEWEARYQEWLDLIIESNHAKYVCPHPSRTLGTDLHL
jgi:hypothetical protein